MKRHQKKQNAASRYVKELREALGRTQQAFAHDIKTAVTTVARWETSNPPPRGETLLKLARIASKNNLSRIGQDLTLMYFEEIMPLLQGVKIRKPACPGFIVCRYDDPSEAARAVEWLRDFVLPDLEEIAKEGQQ